MIAPPAGGAARRASAGSTTAPVHARTPAGPIRPVRGRSDVARPEDTLATRPGPDRLLTAEVGWRPVASRVGPPCPGLRDPIQRLLGSALRWLCAPLEVEGLDHAAGLVGPTLLVANHASHLDAPLVLAALPGEVRARLAVAAAEDRFFRDPLLGLAVSVGLGAFRFPRGRGCALGLLRARHLLEAGWHVLLFPEGTRSRDGRSGPFRPGAAHLARTAGVPVLPIGIAGAHRLMPPGAALPRRGPVRVRFGEPYRPHPDHDVDAITAALAARVAELISFEGDPTWRTLRH